MIGRPNEISPVHSTMMTVKLIVVLRIPPSCDAAPINAYFPTSSSWKIYMSHVKRKAVLGGLRTGKVQTGLLS